MNFLHLLNKLLNSQTNYLSFIPSYLTSKINARSYTKRFCTTKIDCSKFFGIFREIARNEHTIEISEQYLEGVSRAHAPNILHVFQECFEALRFHFLCCYDQKQQIRFPQHFDDLSKSPKDYANHLNIFLHKVQ